MAVRRTTEERVVVAGDRTDWLGRCKRAMEAGDFKKVVVNPSLFQLTGTFRKLTLAGRLEVTLTPVPGGTELAMRSTGSVDNIYALFKSPNQRILQAFKSNL